MLMVFQLTSEVSVCVWQRERDQKTANPEQHVVIANFRKAPTGWNKVCGFHTRGHVSFQANLCCLCLSLVFLGFGSRSRALPFHYQKLITIGADSNEDRLVNCPQHIGAVCISADVNFFKNVGEWEHSNWYGTSTNQGWQCCRPFFSFLNVIKVT